tara:strand:- start:136 stop:339 length:204 start_codon:yes stop_codon:yes gene_type:complete
MRSCEGPYYLPLPEQRGDTIYVRMPDGSLKELDILNATQLAQAWTKAVSGLACHLHQEIARLTNDQT